MKQAFLLFFLFCTLLGLNAQSPSAFKFQAVARDAGGEAIANTNVALRISVRRGFSNGQLVFQERHTATTTDVGVFDLAVGNGTPLFGDLGSVNWGGDDHWLQVEMDPNGGTSYTNFGTSQLMSVPYAMYATESANSDPTDELQFLNLSGTTLSLTNGGSVNLSSIQDGTEDADADPNNEIQNLSLSGSTLSLSDGGGSVNLSGLGGDSPWTQSGNDIFYQQGDVAIGTTTPQAQLHTRSNSTIFDPQIKLEEVGNDFARLEFTNSAANSFWHIAGLPASSPANARLNLFYSPSGGTGFDRMTLTGDGELGVNGTPTARLELYQQGQAVGLGLRFDDGTANQDWDITHGFSLRFHYGGDLRGFINANTGAYTQSSDRRLKDNIQGLGSVIDRVNELRPSTYHYLSDEDKTRVIGFVAQDAKEVFPEFVHYSEADELYGIDYAGFSVVAIRAIQEQQEIIDEQAVTIEAQGQELSELRQRLERLEALLEE
ncbi:MAG: tail fiber domain-containing protein [Bacteroidota bacterium]